MYDKMGNWIVKNVKLLPLLECMLPLGMLLTDHFSTQHAKYDFLQVQINSFWITTLYLTIKWYLTSYYCLFVCILRIPALPNLGYGQSGHLIGSCEEKNLQFARQLQCPKIELYCDLKERLFSERQRLIDWQVLVKSRSFSDISTVSNWHSDSEMNVSFCFNKHAKLFVISCICLTTNYSITNYEY